MRGLLREGTAAFLVREAAGAGLPALWEPKKFIGNK